MWYYENEEYNETPEEYQGFVYVITELDTNKKYIGKKNFWRPKILPKIQKEIDESGHEWNLIGRTTSDRVKKSKRSLNLME